MDMIEGPLVQEPVKETPGVGSQPRVPAIQLEQQLDDAKVREAIEAAEVKGIDPESLKVSDLSQGQEPKVETTEPAKVETPKPDVPEKFRKPDGEVDVEKLKTSTKQLDEALESKETAVQKTVDDYLREYEEKENKFRNLPNPEKLAADVKPQPPPQPTSLPENTDAEFREKILASMKQDFVGTIADLTDMIVEKKMEKRMKPLEEDFLSTREERKQTQMRKNIQSIAEKDPRIMDGRVFNAIQKKLEDDPGLWKSKNPHKAAWLEVKEELRLGDLAPNANPAQPSKSPSPILGSGAPPSPPSSSVTTPQSILSSLDKLDLRDRKQEAQADEAFRALLGGR